MQGAPVPAPCGNKLPDLIHPDHPLFFALFFFLFFNSCGLKNRYRSSRTEEIRFLSFCCGESPRRLRRVLRPSSLLIFRSERPYQRKATASKHSRFTLVHFTLLRARKCGSGEGDVLLDSLSCVPGLTDWNRRIVSSSPSLRLPSDSYALRLPQGMEVTRRYERPLYLGVVVFMFHWAIVPHRQSYAVA